jgi:hypothetical protein
MSNHFKTALNDSYILDKYKDKPLHMAVLNSLSKFIEGGNSLLELPWFSMTKSAKKVLHG